MDIWTSLVCLFVWTVVASTSPLSSKCISDGCSTRSVRKRSLVPQCCACGKATYKLTFQGKWNHQIHPRHYPGPMARWSSLIGCSHSDKYVVWEYGGVSSPGVRTMSEWGATGGLEREMKSLGDNVMSIIKTPGLWWGVGESSAVFDADTNRHVVSLMSRMIPSPDWNVGVDRLNLCTLNCTWAEEKTVDLYPWDAGTDDGITFTSPNALSTPQQPISRITTRLHNHPRASFYLNANDVIRPFARLKLKRLAVSGHCSRDDSSIRKNPFPPKPPRVDCVVTRWSQWTSCSVTCGLGQQIRGRDIITAPKHDGIPCPSLYEHTPCNLARCSRSKRCEVTPWSPWGPCRGTCGVGRKLRMRRIIRQSATPGVTCPILIKKRRCKLSPCQSDSPQAIDCVVTTWSMWSVCSRTCRGKMIRTRQVLTKKRQGGKPCPRLRQKRKCNVRYCKDSRWL